MTHTDNDDLQIVRGSGNIFRDFGNPDADILQLKSNLAAEIIGILDEHGLTARAAKELTGFPAANFSHIFSARSHRLTIDRLIAILNKLGRKVEADITVKLITDSPTFTV